MIFRPLCQRQKMSSGPLSLAFSVDSPSLSLYCPTPEQRVVLGYLDQFLSPALHDFTQTPAEFARSLKLGGDQFRKHTRKCIEIGLALTVSYLLFNNSILAFIFIMVDLILSLDSYWFLFVNFRNNSIIPKLSPES